MVYSLLKDGPQMKQKRGKKSAGVTLVELMIALIVMAIAIIGVVAVMLQTIKAKEITREFDIAKEAAATKLESLRALKWVASTGSSDPGPFLSTLTLGTNSAYNPWSIPELNHKGWTDGTVSYTTGKGYIWFHDTTDGTPLTPTSDFNTELLDIEVRVEWYGIDGLRTYAVRSMFTQ